MHLLVGEVQVDHTVDVVALEEELRLASVAREPVDDEAVVPIVGGEAIPDGGFDEIVVDEVASSP